MKRKNPGAPVLGEMKNLKQRCVNQFFKRQTVNNSASTMDVNTRTQKKEDWIKNLNAEQKKLLQLEITTMDDSWFMALKDEFLKPYFLQLKKFLMTEWQSQRVFPPKEDIYSWSRLTPLNKVRVIILGQDPYHNVGQAHGLSFSVRAGIPCPPSLKNIYRTIKNDYPDFEIPNTGYLVPWAEQGVLMLNVNLTVRAHQANSHAGKGWESFTHAVLQTILKRHPKGLVFLAWGTPAANRLKNLSLATHCVLRSVHPSPLSAHRGFFECQHFKKTNQWLKEKFGEEYCIDWGAVSGKKKQVAPKDATLPTEVKKVVTATTSSETTKTTIEKTSVKVTSTDKAEDLKATEDSKGSVVAEKTSAESKTEDTPKEQESEN
ncbi:uracil DNA N-glycosylase Ung1 [Schizosaccharomyces japonicus yFS275]|uniref:Uracil-DNA glycosylase n=1 Tax=Schizosaccharomyces japonicus (strain yFS275 / FY16936) TaxID=402676 RepID=B6K2R2_SCHJY|nr:uracil DNA N-glycosylase Ung1 [Schizosaccharomyces japonicus yFS275]EEB07443.2 uracil DNA N-glycosylase Ung1 [Schizosaccharomyces japonicus yFS275]